jgi:WhiB family transcriptional regulator, redox-sensing transcriptional regulator
MRYPSFDGTQLCREMDADLFFPPSGGDGLVLAREAKKICDRCEWQNECAEWALHHADPFGIFGGLTPADRHKLRKKLNIVPDVLTLSDVFGRQRNSEDVCDEASYQ